MLCWVANQMAKKGHDVYAVSYFAEDHPLRLEDNVNYHSLNLIQSKSRINRNTLQMLKVVRKVNKYIKSQNPDLVVSFLDSVGYVYLLKNKIFGKIKTVVSERVDPYAYKGVLSKIRFFLMNMSDGIVFQTEGAKNFFKEDIQSKSTVIPNPVSIKKDVAENLSDYQLEYSKRDNRVVTAGRLSISQKRQDILIDAFEIVHNAYPEIKLVIYGEGGDKGRILSMIEEKKLTDCIVLAGRTNEVEKEIYNARAFVMTSDYEGIPNALIEAMTLGVPSVSTDCSPGGARLLIEDGVNGFLVPRKDVHEIAQKLICLIEDESISNKFSKNSPAISDKFSEDKISALWETYFKKITDKE